MKKIIIISFLFSTFTPNIFAQKKINIYAAGNFGMCKVKINPVNANKISSNFSGAIGAHLIYKLQPNIDLIAMPVLQQRGYKIENYSTIINYDVRVTYLDLPIGIELGFGLRGIVFSEKFEKGSEKPFFIGAGAYGGIALGGRYIDKYALAEPSTKLKIGESLTANRSTTDYGLIFNLGMRFPVGNSYIRFGFQKQVGLKNVVPSARQANDGSIKTTNFGFFVAYNISNVFNKK